MVQKDNTTLADKVRLRRRLLEELSELRIIETHGGTGEIYRETYTAAKTGVVFDTDTIKAKLLSRQRPHWAVYEADCVDGLKNGLGELFDATLIDVDPYGQPWPILETVFENAMLADRVGIAVNDGLRQKLKMNGGWTVESLRPQVEKYGNQTLYMNYLDICEEKLETLIPENYSLEAFGGYYTGHGKQITHYGAILERED